MSGIAIKGIGAVTPAGWGVSPMRDALAKGDPIPVTGLPRPGKENPLRVRMVPAPTSRPGFLAHPRLRRTSSITHYAVAAALEALGDDADPVRSGALSLGIVFCTMTGCVNYSRRFYNEALKDPATASPLVFPETVFNAPASHLAALIGATSVNYTLVGDPGTFLQGLAVAADWLVTGRVEGCIVVGAEELDWLTAEAYRLFTKSVVLSAGAGAVYLRGDRPEGGPTLQGVTDSQIFFDTPSRFEAARRVRSELRGAGPGQLLCDGTQAIRGLDNAENDAWSDWSGARLSPKTLLGEGLAAASAWQCVAAIDALQQQTTSSAVVSVVGCNQQAIGAHFHKVI